MVLSLPFLFALYIGSCAAASHRDIIFNGNRPITAEAGGMHNVHLRYTKSIDGQLSIHYGGCSIEAEENSHHCLGTTHVGRHPLAKRHLEWKDSRPTKFVWLPPSDVPDSGCLHAFSDGNLIGTSEPVRVTRRRQRRQESFADVADPDGPWFDGVQYLEQKEPDEIFVAQAKSKTIGIIGGGMSGLMTAYLLDSVGIHDWKILEASHRIGGRVHTSYLNGTKPEDYQYQEMGPMRFPVEIKYAGTNETIEIQDHRMVFQLGDALNNLNSNDSSLAVKFIPFLQYVANTPASTSKRRPDGTIPGRAEVAANPALADNKNLTYSDPDAVAEGLAAYSDFLGLDKGRMEEIAANVFRAHKKAIEDGLFDYSESMYLREALHLSTNITDQIDSTGDYFPAWPYENVYFSATTWKTIDKGLTSLPKAFGPLVLNRTTFGIPVSALSFNETTQKISAHWRPTTSNPFALETSSLEFDYAIIAAPFSKIRLWRLPAYSSLLSRAIKTLNYQQACKVALHYKTRFWEHLEYPIIGGCGETNIPGIGSICYPSYKINSTLPGVLLASYNSGVEARTLASMSEIDHVALVQRAMIETHGPIAGSEFTGAYDRICWENDPYQAGAWCSPLVGQEELYLPAYYQTEFKTIFVGEHTSFTHAWIFSALESAVRGTAQLLLDMGLVDEAKEVTGVWMARWMKM